MITTHTLTSKTRMRFRLEHYVSRHDLQTAAVITCVLDGVTADGRVVKKRVQKRRRKREESDGVFERVERPKFMLDTERPQRMRNAFHRPISECSASDQVR